jgi:hypothetical protein
VYASPWSSPSTTQHSLPGGRYPFPGPDFHRLDRASFAWRTASTFYSTDAGWFAAPASIAEVNSRIEDTIAEVNLRLDRIERLIVSPPSA